MNIDSDVSFYLRTEEGGSFRVNAQTNGVASPFTIKYTEGTGLTVIHFRSLDEFETVARLMLKAAAFTRQAGPGRL